MAELPSRFIVALPRGRPLDEAPAAFGNRPHGHSADVVADVGLRGFYQISVGSMPLGAWVAREIDCHARGRRPALFTRLSTRLLFEVQRAIFDTDWSRRSVGGGGPTCGRDSGEYDSK